MQVIELTELVQLMAEKKAWQELAASIANPFADFNIILSWLELFLKNKKIFILKILESERVIAYAPFYRSGQSIGWLGEGRVNYLDLICREADKELVWPKVLFYLQKKKIKTIKLVNVNSSTFSSGILEKNGFKIIKQQTCPVMPINTEISWENFYNGVLKNKRRYEVRKGLEGLSAAGDFKIINKTRVEIDDHDIANIFFLYKKRWQSTYRSKIIADSYYQHQKNLIKNSENIFLSMAFLGDQLISFILGFKKQRIFTDYWVAHDQDYADYSLGSVHLKLLIEQLHQEGFKLFDFSIGEDVYKRKWAKDQTYNNDYIKTGFINYWAFIYWNKLRKIIIPQIKKLLFSK